MVEEGKTSISKAGSYEEIGEFWDNHDFTDYLDDSQIVDFNTSDIRSSPTKSTSTSRPTWPRKSAPSPSAKEYQARF